MAADSQVNYTASSQSKLAITAKKDTRFTVDSGMIDTLMVNSEDNASVSAEDATIAHAKLSLEGDTDVSLGTVQTLDIEHADSCPAGRQSRIDVWNIKELTVNGAVKTAETANLACMTLKIEGDTHDRS
jgi:hypothetical protein